jgi:hypothetical protein
MGLDAILFSYEDQQNFVMELPVGTLNAPVDILFETDLVATINNIL